MHRSDLRAIALSRRHRPCDLLSKAPVTADQANPAFNRSTFKTRTAERVSAKGVDAGGGLLPRTRTGHPDQEEAAEHGEDAGGDHHGGGEPDFLDAEARQQRPGRQARRVGEVVQGERASQRGRLRPEALLAHEGGRRGEQQRGGDPEQGHPDARLPEVAGPSDHQKGRGHHGDAGPDEHARRCPRHETPDDGIGDDARQRGHPEQEAYRRARRAPAQMPRQDGLHGREDRCADGDGDDDRRGAGDLEDRQRPGGIVGLPGRPRDQAEQGRQIEGRDGGGDVERRGRAEGVDEEPGQGRADEHAQGYRRQCDAHHLAAPLEAGRGGDERERRHPRHAAGDPLREAREKEKPVRPSRREEQRGSGQDDQAGHERHLGAPPVDDAAGEQGRDDHRHRVGGEEDSRGGAPLFEHRGKKRQDGDRQAVQEHVGEQDGGGHRRRPAGRDVHPA